MSRTALHLVRLILPLYDNEGRAFPRADFDRVRDELTERFGGITAFVRSPAQGTWKERDGEVDRDEVVMCEVVVESLERGWWASYRTTLEKRFGQRELMLRALPVERL